MRNRWSDEEAARFVMDLGATWGPDLALRTYASRLLGVDAALVLHGGGNTSLKGTWRTRVGEQVAAIFVKASGYDMASIAPDGHSPLDLERLRRLRALPSLDDAAMLDELRLHLLNSRSATPSIETLVHAFLPPAFVDHTHADAILVLTNQRDGESLIREALGPDVLVLPYVVPGFQLALAAASAFESSPRARGMVLMQHGLISWGETARESYERTIELVSAAEAFIARRRRRAAAVTIMSKPPATLASVAPFVRGALVSAASSGAGRQRLVLQPLATPEVLTFLGRPDARELALTPPLTSDHLIRTKPFPLWIDLQGVEAAVAADRVRAGVRQYCADYEAYFGRHADQLPSGVERFDPAPRIVLIAGLGVLCAGVDVNAAAIARDITAQSIRAKAAIGDMGSYEGLSEADLFHMEYRPLQHAKLRARADLPLAGHITLITGAAGAIGSGVARRLLAAGSHVAVTDLAGEALSTLETELSTEFGSRVAAIPLDVTNPESVACAFSTLASHWGGLDLLVANAGVAHVSSVTELDIEVFRRLECINVEGTLLVVREAARMFQVQAAGGDIVLISTKNVFAPGARFGAYSATKAAAHQLARIASLELAEFDVRVNMVAPDAVFGSGTRRSGLWAAIGPDRMRARGLDEAGLEEYYRNRNLLKARVTAEHVANAVLFFATRQTPTTGATIPVDGGLPDATPR